MKRNELERRYERIRGGVCFMGQAATCSTCAYCRSADDSDKYDDLVYWCSLARKENPIKAARVAAKLTQARAARLLGVPRRSLQDWEDDRRTPQEGVEYWTERLNALSIFTESGLEGIEEGDVSLDVALAQWRIYQVEKLSKWGRYQLTFQKNWDMIPDDLKTSLSVESLAELVDAFQEAFDAGVSHGIKTR